LRRRRRRIRAVGAARHRLQSLRRWLLPKTVGVRLPPPSLALAPIDDAEVRGDEEATDKSAMHRRSTGKRVERLVSNKEDSTYGRQWRRERDGGGWGKGCDGWTAACERIARAC
jgi:hypothetical protein